MGVDVVEEGVEGFLFFLFVWVIDGGEGEIECLVFLSAKHFSCC